MPEATATFGIVYPCSGETIDCAMFEDFTGDIQDAIDTVETLEESALNRPAARVDGAGQAITENVATTLTYTTEVFDNDTMANLGVNNDRLTVVTAGIYLVTGNIEAVTSVASPTSGAVAIVQTGTTRYRRKMSNTANTSTIMGIQVIGLLSCAVADTIQLSVLFTGDAVGAPIMNLSSLSAYLVATP